jgi:uncharacterized protein with NAD-binding domain and iron-sulfur cluster
VPDTVAILGGGVAGLSAAHELMERGFDVTVYEARDMPGGKARSIPVPYTSGGANLGTLHTRHGAATMQRDLPGEHGFRFFPRFYRHIVDTMGRIPARRSGMVADHLVDTERVRITRFHHRHIDIPVRSPRNLNDFQAIAADFQTLWDPELGIPWDERLFFAQRVWQILTSCEERRLGEYEKLNWWDFIGAASRSADYQAFLGLGLTRSLVASRAELASTRTIGDILVQLLIDIAEPGVSSDRVLDGPTSEVWIHPWLEYLQSRGVKYRLNSRLRSLKIERGVIKSVTIEENRKLSEVRADYYVAAVPVEVMARLVTPELIAADPGLANIVPLSKNTAWMNGIQFYLNQDVPIVRGHVLYVDSPWALTSISQRQFWPDVVLSERGRGQVSGIISVDISNWDTPGLNGKPARECTRDEIHDDTWAQLKRSLNVEGQDVLKDEFLVDFFLDPDIDPLTRRNGEPLLVNLVDTWRLRPEASTAIPNLFLASDYVRTHTDLATMESANEAARRAVNGIIRRSGSAAPLCQVWELYEPPFLAPFKAYDLQRYERGQPWDDTLARVATGTIDATRLLHPYLGVIAAASLAALEYLQEHFPHLRFLQGKPPLLAHFASLRNTQNMVDGDQFAPWLEESAEIVNGLVTAIRSALESNTSETPSAAPATTPATPDTGRVRFVQR